MLTCLSRMWLFYFSTSSNKFEVEENIKLSNGRPKPPTDVNIVWLFKVVHYSSH